MEVPDKEELKESLLDDVTYEEEIAYQRTFQDHLLIELEKVAFFFRENYNYNLARFEKIKVYSE